MTEYKTLCSTKTKRQKLAKEIEILAAEMGATVTTGEYDQPFEITMCLRYGSYRVSMRFCGKTNVGAFLGHWHTDVFSEAKYPSDFGYVIGGSMNTHHYGKATTCEYAFEGFKSSLKAGLNKLSQNL